MSKCNDLLSCWHKLEHFSPSSLTRENAIEIKNVSPWQGMVLDFEAKTTSVFTVFLGVFKSSEVIDFVSDYFKEEDTNENRKSEDICYASIKLNKAGQFIEDTLGISTLPWALGQLEKGALNSNQWKKDFDSLKDTILEAIDNILYEVLNSESETEEDQRALRVLDTAALQAIQEVINKNCEWSHTPKTKFYYKEEIITIHDKNRKTKTISAKSKILNSFYVQDIERIINDYKGKDGSAFSRYLNGNLDVPIDRMDINEDISVVQKMLEPHRFPDGCWPSSYSLNLMQQFAVNTIINEQQNATNRLFSVNGPPGTGKTTLLRHAIAGIIVERAKKLSAYKKPEDAFTKFGSLANNKEFTYQVYTPLSELNIGGIVIASANNGALENITKELPLQSEISPYEDLFSYFTEASQKVVPESWGLLSAVLGKMLNRKTFKSKYWISFKEQKRHEEALLGYFKKNTIKNLDTWHKIVKRFNNKIQEIHKEKDRLENIRIKSANFSNLKSNIEHIKKDIKISRTLLLDTTKTKTRYRLELDLLRENEDKLWERLKVVQSTKPNIFIYWIHKKGRIAYKQRLQTVFDKQQKIESKLELAEAVFNQTESELKQIETRLQKLVLEQESLNKTFKVLLNAKEELENNYADTAFWEAIESKEVQNSCPWYSSKLQHLQTESFALALELHETLLLTANRKSNMIQTTLGGFFEYMNENARPDAKTLEALWNTFFMMIPVVSTTFSSADRLFGKIGAEQLPWLFIDEAGQAVPQAAVGMIWRSKRVVVVGDPLQIEPVVTIPDIITKNIRTYFNLNPRQIHPELSVQVGVDRANSYGTFLNSNTGEDTWIGAPLRVHRRCVDPMFSIANKIAYDNTMFLSTSSPENLPLQLQTEFIHCTGQVVNKHYVEEQAAIVCELLKTEIISSGGLPDVYVISPFSEVSEALKKNIRVKIDFKFDGLSPKDSAIEYAKWIKEHVGTVHTFQGKQADGVILCLGLDERTKGSANWASQKPNILNVALTRAKYKFVAIGDETIWLKQSYFKELKGINSLPVMQH